MNRVLFLTFIASFSMTAHSRCLVEILNEYGEPIGQTFQENSCPPAMTKCRAVLARLAKPNLKCEITLDIPQK